MKKILMSIFLVFLLAFSMLGNVVKAESDNILVTTPESIVAIKGIDQSVDILFTVTNGNAVEGDALDLNLEITPPRFEGNALNVELVEPENENFNLVAGASQNILLSVSGINQETVVGYYIGTVRIQDTQEGGEDNFKEIDYTIIVVENQEPIVTITEPSITTIAERETVEFVGTAPDETGDVENYRWEIKDSEDNFEAPPYNRLEGFSHLFDELGVYTVTLTATDEAGLEGSDTKTITVEEENPVLKLYDEDGTNEILTDSKIRLSGSEETSPNPQKTYTIRNQGNVDLENVQITFTGNFIDNSDEDDVKRIRLYVNNEEITLENPYSLDDISKDGNQNIVIKASIPEDTQTDSYKGTLTITAESTLSNEIVTYLNEKFEVVVEPKTCKDGIIGRLSIKDLEVDDDDLEIGESIELDLTVKNRYDNDLDVVVEAMLYNLDSDEKIIDWTEVGSQNIDEDEEEDFSLDLKIPLDNEDIKAGDTYILYVKAFEDGDEDDHCDSDNIEIEIDRDDDAVMVSKFTITPTTVSVGNIVSFTVSVLNIGNDDQDDVYIQIIDPELGLDLKSINFDLDKYSKSDNDMTKTFTFTVPEDAEAKEYQIKAAVYDKKGNVYDNEDGFIFEKLIVQGESTPGDDTTTGDTTDTTGTTVTTGTGAGTFQPTSASIFDNLGSTKTLFIIGDIVLVILAVLFLILIFRKR